MPRPPRLSPDEIAAALHGLPSWSGDGDSLHRTAELPSFRDAVDAIVAIADVAEEMDHHPDVDRYTAEHGIPVNPLFEIGYGSIGCAPCTQPVAPGEDPRAGRWAGLGKTECGIHS